MHAVTKWLPVVVRSLLGLVFLVFGLNGFLHFLPQPPVPGPAGQLLGAFAGAGYLFPLIKATEIAGGLALLTGRFVPLGLAVLAPVVVNIAAFHFFLTPGQIVMAVLLLAAEVYLAWAYRDAFRGMLSATAKPASAKPATSEVEGQPIASAAE